MPAHLREVVRQLAGQLAGRTSLDTNLHQTSDRVQGLVKHAAEPAAVPMCDDGIGCTRKNLYLCEWVLLQLAVQDHIEADLHKSSNDVQKAIEHVALPAAAVPGRSGQARICCGCRKTGKKSLHLQKIQTNDEIQAYREITWQ